MKIFPLNLPLILVQQNACKENNYLKHCYIVAIQNFLRGKEWTPINSPALNLSICLKTHYFVAWTST